jgi:hypothetical protein
VELDLQIPKFIGLYVTWCAQPVLIGWDPPPPPPPAFGLIYEGRYWSARIDDISLWLYLTLLYAGTTMRRTRFSCLLMVLVFVEVLLPALEDTEDKAKPNEAASGLQLKHTFSFLHFQNFLWPLLNIVLFCLNCVQKYSEVVRLLLEKMI